MRSLCTSQINLAAQALALAALRRARRVLRRVWWLGSRVFVLGLIAGLVFGLPWFLRAPDLSALDDLALTLQGSEDEVLQLRLNSTGKWREGISLSEIDPRMIQTLIAFEDRRFYRHIGVDFRALGRATWSLAQEGRIVSGGSTITMQLARLLDPSLQSRGLWTKVRQIAHAVRLDWHMSKTEILEAYFTLAPYGGNVEGLKAATTTWFRQSPASLTPSQIGLLVALPQSPERRRPDLHADRALAAKGHVLTSVAKLQQISAEDLADYVAEGLPLETYRPPALGQHAFDRLARESGFSFDAPSHLNATWQAMLGELLRDEIAAYPIPINAAAMVVERRTGRVRAYQGAADYGQTARKGGNNFLASTRSPGSLLKPFIYAMALEEGYLAPDHVFTDQTFQIDAYAPGNFDNRFSGQISLADALVTSRNIPAIETLQGLGSQRMTRTLEAVLGRPASVATDQGLSLAVGSFSMTAEEVVQLYLSLIDPDHPARLRFQGNDLDGAPESPLISAQTAQTLLSLMATPRADGAGYRVFKTGTSQHRQDAHALVITADHLIYTWLGTPDNEATQILSGAEAALPLAERIQAALELAAPQVQPLQPSPANPLIPSETCQNPIRVPEDGDWLRLNDLRVHVELSQGVSNLYLNGKEAILEGQVLTLPEPGAHRLTAVMGACRQTIEIFVEPAP